MSINVGVTYHFEDGLWWAESDDAPGYYAGADTLEQLRQDVREGLEFHFEDSVEVSEEIVEIVSRTHPRDDIEIEQRVRHQADHAITLASTQLTTSASWPIRRLPGPAVAAQPQPSTWHERAMAGY